jgi:uncharacterized protein YndB with AHSA1/START domain
MSTSNLSGLRCLDCGTEQPAIGEASGPNPWAGGNRADVRNTAVGQFFQLTRHSLFYLSAFSLTVCGPAGRAEVPDVAANGFTVQIDTHIAAPPDKVYAALIEPAAWWGADHTFSRDAKNLHLQAKAGGCWCERLPNGGSVLHLTVVYVDPGKALRLRGALGPFQGLGGDGALTWKLKPAAGEGTDVSTTYAFSGYNKDGFASLSKAADGVLTEQMGRLKKLIETRSPDGH